MNKNKNLFCVSLVAGVLLCFLLTPQIARSEKATYKNIPVFDLRDETQKTHSLEVKVKEKKYPPDMVYEIADLIDKAESETHTAEDVVRGYLGHFFNKRFDELYRFYHPDYLKDLPGSMDPKKLAQFKSGYLDNVGKVQFIRSWHFGEHYQQIHLSQFDASGKTDFFSLSVKKIGDKYYIVDTWKDYNDVQFLFFYMGGNIRDGIDKKFPSRDFDYSITLNESDKEGDLTKGDPLTVYFDGTFYDFQKEWIPLGEIGPELSFVHKVIMASIEGTDEEFIELYKWEDREWVKESLRINPKFIVQDKSSFRIIKAKGVYRSLKKEEADINHIFTMKLGTHWIHYYKFKSEPGKVRFMVLKNKDGEFGLSRIKSANIYGFVTDENVVDEIMKLWKTSKK